MESPVKRSGWAGMEAPKTVERKRKGTSADTVLPTPPRGQLPTPETLRRTVKRSTKVDAPAVAGPSQLPTPQTLVRHSRKTSITHALPSDTAVEPSPSGHTTFFLSSSTASRERESGSAVRRRPGLTFAQQMGLIPGGSRVGVGIGGSKSGSHKKDKIRLERSVERQEEENPFLAPWASLASPGDIHPGIPSIQVDGDHVMSSPRQSRKTQQTLQSPALLDSAGCLPTPPSTFRGQRMATPPALPLSPTTVARQAASERRARAEAVKAEKGAKATAEKERKARAAEEARKEKIRQMRDEDDNPFLVKPGESSIRPHKHPVVDESHDLVTYVFRGAKRVFSNPFIGPKTRVRASELDPTHPDYEDHPCPPPKLLWPSAPESPSTKASSSRRKAVPDPNVTPPRRTSRKIPQTRPSPPSSPIPTPFDVEEEAGFDGPANVFTSDDEFVPEGQLPDAEVDDVEVTVRRGLLFGPSSRTAAQSGIKRGMESQGASVRRNGKKAKSARMR